VEDDALIRMGVAEALRNAGYIVIEACNAAEAMDVVLSGIAPDVLFADVKLPGHVDGLQLAALLERLIPGLIVVIASGRFMPDDLRLKVNFLRKPFGPETVVAHLARVAPPPRA